MCGTSWGRHRAGKGEAQTPLSEHRADTHLGLLGNQLRGMEMGFPIMGGWRLGWAGGTAVRCPRQKTSPCQPEMLASTPKFRAQKRKQLKRAESVSA